VLTLYEIDGLAELIFHNYICTAIATPLCKIRAQPLGNQLVSYKLLQSEIA
jgi:hypothetical protein